MSIRQTLTSAQSGTVWSRREGGTTYFLRKIANRYEAWTSLDSGSKRTVTIDQAVAFYSQHNLVNATAAARPEPAAPTRPAPPPSPPPARPSADQQLQNLRNGGGIINVNANLSIIYEDGQYLSFDPRNARLADIRLRTAAEIKNGNASPITIAQAKAAITNGAKTTTSAPTTTKATPPEPKPKPKPAPVKPDVTPAPKPEPKPVDKPATPDDEKLAIPVLTEEQIAAAGQDALADIEASLPPLTEVAAISEQTTDIYDDWRVRLSLAPSSNYLYNAESPGILAPLKETGGVIFPYTPQISVNYVANYDQSSIIHNNYKVYQYSNSGVENVTITCDFTAQDTREANYLLAVIHFFRSASKMFFGQDQNPRAGTPPPLCYLTGMGSYQFSQHPLAITGFTYNLPIDVDYIKTVGPSFDGAPLPANPLSVTRLPDNIKPGGTAPPPNFSKLALSPEQNGLVTWVPTKIQLSISANPMMSRSQVSQEFSLEKYARGDLLNIRNSPDGGFW